jgi:hypothetical protein
MLVQAYARDIQSSAYNERSFQCQQIKLCWLSKTNPEYRMAENVLEKELDNDPESIPRVHANLQGTVEGVKELQRLMVSPELYNNPILFDFFCAGLESGHFRGSKFRCSKTDISKLITVSHEAHFRTELWFALSKKAFRHNSYKKGNKVRVKKFKEALAAVRKGREKHMLNALKLRHEGRDPNIGDVANCDDGDSDDACILDDSDL